MGGREGTAEPYTPHITRIYTRAFYAAAAGLADLPGLAGRIGTILDDEPRIAWDAALARIVAEIDA
jgi:hypothetical protein